MTTTTMCRSYRFSTVVGVALAFSLSLNLAPHVTADRLPSTSADGRLGRHVDVQSIHVPSMPSEDVSAYPSGARHSPVDPGDGEQHQVKHFDEPGSNVQTDGGKEDADSEQLVDSLSLMRDGGRGRPKSRKNANDEEKGDDGTRTKRKWGKVSLQAWGKRDGVKRKWGATNSLTSWGKRPSNGGEETNDEAIGSPRDRRRWGQKDLTAWGKRKWGAKSTFAPWGKRKWSKSDVSGSNFELGEVHRLKRSAGLYDGDDDEREAMYEPWRSTGYKRQWRRTNGRYNGPKRTWEANTMKAWGKRSGAWPGENEQVWGIENDDNDNNKWKRAWSSDNSLRIWGKRNNILDGLHDWDRRLDLL